MVIYIIVVFGIVVVTSALLMLILYRIEMLNYRMILAVSLGSVLSGLLFPGILNLVSIGRGVMLDVAQLAFVLAATLVLYFMLILILSVIISVVIPDSKFAALASGLKRTRAVNGGGGASEVKKAEAPDQGSSVNQTNYLEEIYGNMLDEEVKSSSNTDEGSRQPENNSEKSVDSAENIDKMRLDAFEEDISLPDDNLQQIGLFSGIDITNQKNTVQAPAEAGVLNLEECVEEAFRLKIQGDYESAILYFMYALDRKPGRDLTFWIVLDICVMYRSIGQADFAREMLSTYFDTYGSFMDDGIREEIERNLLYMYE